MKKEEKKTQKKGNMEKLVRLTEEQLDRYSKLIFGYNESQIDDDEYKTGLLEIMPSTCVLEYKMLTGMYVGHTVNVIEVVNIENLPDDEDDEDYLCNYE